MKTLSLPANPETFSKLYAAYSEPHRHYHTMTHIQYCLAGLDRFAAATNRLAEIELAIWFHDAVYSPQSKKNEAKSAEWAQDFIVDSGGSQISDARIFQMIMATEHNGIPGDADTKLLVDIDLSILGAAPNVYNEFEIKVRKEYRWVPKPLFRRERKKILQSFLGRETVFGTPRIRDKLEAQARSNLELTIARL